MKMLETGLFLLIIVPVLVIVWLLAGKLVWEAIHEVRKKVP